jgi:hypothetical protein
VLELLAVADEMEPQEYEQAFDAIFDDEDMDADEREALREAQMQRRQEEAMRKRQLKAEYEAKRVQAEEARMYELRAIQEAEEQREREEAEELAAASHATEASMAAMDFGGFSFGDAAPAASSTSKGSVKGSVKSKAAVKGSVKAKPVAAAPPAQAAPPPISPKPARKQPPRISPKPTATAEPAVPAPLTTSTPPVVAVKPTAVPASSGTAAGAATGDPKEPRRRKVVRGGNKKEAPVLQEFQDAMSALDDLDGMLEPWAHSIRRKPKPTPPTAAGATASAPATTQAPAPSTTQIPPAAPGEDSTAPAAKPVSETKEPRRRKLVRGGNSKETPVLEEYTSAMSSLEDLEAYLDPYAQSIRRKPKVAAPAVAGVVSADDGRPPPPSLPSGDARPAPPPAPSARPPPPSVPSVPPTTAPPTAPPTTAPPTTAPTTDEPKEPRRRKLVRGGNKKEAPVMQEFEDAMSALNALDGMLEEHGALDHTLNAMSDAGDQSGMFWLALFLASLSFLHACGVEARRRLSSYGSPTHSQSKLSEEEYDQFRYQRLSVLSVCINNQQFLPSCLLVIVLLTFPLAHLSSTTLLEEAPNPVTSNLPPFDPNATPTTSPASSPKRAQSSHAIGRTDSQSSPQRLARANTALTLSPEFVQSMDETQRIALLHLVRDGDMTIEEAIAQVWFCSACYWAALLTDRV